MHPWLMLQKLLVARGKVEGALAAVDAADPSCVVLHCLALPCLALPCLALPIRTMMTKEQEVGSWTFYRLQLLDRSVNEGREVDK